MPVVLSPGRDSLRLYFKIDKWIDMKTRIVTLFILICSLIAPSQYVFAKTFIVDRFDVTIDIQPGNIMFVTDTITANFADNPADRFSLEMAMQQADSVEILSAAMDGTVMPYGTAAGQVEVQGAVMPQRIIWHFPATSEAKHTFTLQYRVAGAIRREADRDSLIWQVITKNHEFEIVDSAVTVNYPAGVKLFEAPKIQGRLTKVEYTSDTQVILSVHEIWDSAELVAYVCFPLGSVITELPQWQIPEKLRDEQFKSALPFGALALLVVLLAGGIPLAVIWRRNNAPLETVFRNETQTTPPNHLPPTLAHILINELQVDQNQIIATLVHLAIRGYIKIEQVLPDDNHGKDDFLIKNVDRDRTELRKYETALLNKAFRTRRGILDQIPLSRLSMELMDYQPQFASLISEEALKTGLLDEERQAQRRRVSSIGLAALAAGAVLLIIASLGILNLRLELVQAATILAGVALGSASVFLFSLILIKNWNILSNQGANDGERWLAFYKHLKGLTRLDAGLQSDWMDDYLAYALAFGFGKAWVRAFKKQKIETPATWFETKGDVLNGLAIFTALSSASTSSEG
jgi:hypothetical protein